MTHNIDLFWSFRSPYSHLVTPRLIKMEDEWDLRFSVRPVYPLALRQPDFFQREHPGWINYLLTDVIRLSEYLGVPIALPNPDPVVMDPETQMAVTDQPYIHRLTRLGVAAAKTGKGLAFLNAVSTEIWSGQDWTENGVLEKAVAKTGFDLQALDKAIDDDQDSHDAIIKANAQALENVGHWGVPTMAYNGEAFFGQDRLDLLLWRLKQNGLQPRTKTG